MGRMTQPLCKFGDRGAMSSVHKKNDDEVLQLKM